MATKKSSKKPARKPPARKPKAVNMSVAAHVAAIIRETGAAHVDINYGFANAHGNESYGLSKAAAVQGDSIEMSFAQKVERVTLQDRAQYMHNDITILGDLAAKLKERLFPVLAAPDAPSGGAEMAVVPADAPRPFTVREAIEGGSRRVQNLQVDMEDLLERLELP